MKLYATVENNNGISKGQGGHKSLEILLQIEHNNKERENFCTLELQNNENNFSLFLIENNTISPTPIKQIKKR